MYKTKEIKYKTIFKQDGHTETLEHQGEAKVKYGDTMHIAFHMNEDDVHIKSCENEVELINGDSKLKLVKDNIVSNEYVIPYGTTLIRTKLVSLQVSEDVFKMKYELYDQEDLIMSTYMMIKLKDPWIGEEDETIKNIS